MSAFKAYDIRGIFGTEITEDLAYKLGRAFVQLLQCKEVVIGHDMRTSSKILATALIKGITEQGANVIMIGLTDTPLFYFACKNTPGIMITASHNPAEYNGFKLVNSEGMPLYEDNGMKTLQTLVEKNNFPKTEKKGEITKRSYVQDCLSFFLKQAKNIKPLRIIFDGGNGMGGLTHAVFYREIGCKVISLFPEPDGTFPHHEPNPMKEENRKHAREAVLLHHADLAILTDGDADRIMFLDEKGNYVHPDHLIALLAEYFLEKKPGASFVYDLRCSRIVPETIQQKKGKAYPCRVGNRFLKKMMKENNAIFGGEVSAHFLFKETNDHESPLLTALTVLKIMSEKNKKLSELILPFQKYAKIEEENFSVKDKEKVIKTLTEKYKQGNLSLE